MIDATRLPPQPEATDAWERWDIWLRLQWLLSRPEDVELRERSIDSQESLAQNQIAFALACGRQAAALEELTRLEQVTDAPAIPTVPGPQ